MKEKTIEDIKRDKASLRAAILKRCSLAGVKVVIQASNIVWFDTYFFNLGTITTKIKIDYREINDVFETCDTILNFLVEDFEIPFETCEEKNFKYPDFARLINPRKHNEVERVIFNDPATIVFWADGTKTIVKADGEPFDEEKGLAMAISKKFLGNSGDYYEVFKKFCPEEKIRKTKRFTDDK